MNKVGDHVEIKEFNGGKWGWTGRKGHVSAEDTNCLTVRTDDGENIRDVREHFRTPK